MPNPISSAPPISAFSSLPHDLLGEIVKRCDSESKISLLCVRYMSELAIRSVEAVKVGRKKSDSKLPYLTPRQQLERIIDGKYPNLKKTSILLRTGDELEGIEEGKKLPASVSTISFSLSGKNSTIRKRDLQILPTKMKNIFFHSVFKWEESAEAELGIRLPHLKKFSAWNCKIEARLIKAISESSSIVHVELFNTNVKSEDLKYFGKMKNLQRLCLENTKIDSQGITNLVANGGNSSIYHLNICGNRIGPEGTTPILKISSLTELLIANNRIGDKGLGILTEHPSLCSLNASRNRITEAGISDFSLKRHRIEKVDFSYNFLGGPAVEKLSERPLKILRLTGTNLRTLNATTLSKNTSIEELDLRENDTLTAAAISVLKDRRPPFKKLLI